MREILFKGKCELSGEWVYGDLIQTEIKQIFKDGGLFKVIPETVAQFFGLIDKDGAKIFEGDIIEIKEFWNNGFSSFSSEERDFFELDELKGEIKKQYVSDIFFEDGCFVIKATGDNDFYDTFLIVLFGNQKHSQPIFEYKVIGNIHDNPQLAQS